MYSSFDIHTWYYEIANIGAGVFIKIPQAGKYFANHNTITGILFHVVTSWYENNNNLTGIYQAKT